MKEPVEQLFPRYSRLAYRVLKIVLGGLLRILYRVRVEGVERLPAGGPVVLAANHVSFLDSLIIPLVVPRRVTYLAKGEYWESAKTRWFFNMVGQIPVRRGDAASAEAAIEAGCRVLGAEGALGIYPEGTRSLDGRLYRGRTGVARLAGATGASVVPVGVVGTREIMPKERKLPRLGGSVSITFGEPMRITEDELREDPLAARVFVDAVMFEIMTLTGQDYVERYADRPLAEEPREAGEQRIAQEHIPTP